jgi:type IV pilus assembly protein PilO
MRQIEKIRTRLLIVLGVLLVIDIAAVGLLLSPVGRSREARIQEYDRVRTQLQAKRRDALPARDMDKKLGTARTEISEFYKERLPQRYSDVSDSLGKLAKESNVQLGQIKYTAKSSDLADLQRLEIDASVSGDYPNLMRFINGLEREKTTYVLDSVELGEGQGGTVRLNINLETYLRSGQSA